MNRTARSSTILALTGLLSAAPSLAGDQPNDRRGWTVGFDLGVGGSALEYKRPAGNYKSDEEQVGGAFGLHGGYGFSDAFLLTLDTRGYEQQDDGLITRMGSTVAMATWHIAGGGFFLRAGGGAGRVETELEDGASPTTAVVFKETGPVMAFGLGYEWRLGEKFALGLSLDSRGIDLDDFEDVTDITTEEGTIGLQFNWYL